MLSFEDALVSGFSSRSYGELLGIGWDAALIAESGMELIRIGSVVNTFANIRESVVPVLLAACALDKTGVTEAWICSVVLWF